LGVHYFFIEAFESNPKLSGLFLFPLNATTPSWTIRLSWPLEPEELELDEEFKLNLKVKLSLLLKLILSIFIDSDEKGNT